MKVIPGQGKQFPHQWLLTVLETLAHTKLSFHNAKGLHISEGNLEVTQDYVTPRIFIHDITLEKAFFQI